MNTTKRVVVLTCGWLVLAVATVRAAEPTTAELIGALKSADEAARLQAVDQLGSQGAEAAAAVTPLVELLKDSSPTVRAHAARVAGRDRAGGQAGRGRIDRLAGRSRRGRPPAGDPGPGRHPAGPASDAAAVRETHGRCRPGRRACGSSRPWRRPARRPCPP